MSEVTNLINESKSLREEINSLNPVDHHSKPTIVVWGLMNAGKSYLLNMLSEHIENPYFKVADQRETAVNKDFDAGDRVYVDTPGLDANDSDDLEAFLASKTADIVLFVHQLQGELEAKEIEFLKALKESFGEYASKNIVMVLSKIDKEDEEKVVQIQSRVLQQCQKDLDFTPKIFQVSNTIYQTGVTEHEDLLIKYSHIDELKAHLDSLVSDVSSVRNERDKKEKQILSKKHEALEKKITKKIKQLESEIQKSDKEFNKLIREVRQTIQASYNEYTDNL